jgi:hypothetical protein
LPAASVWRTVIVHVPATSGLPTVPSVHDPLDTVQVTDKAPDFAAVTTAVVPTSSPVTSIVGVVSDVMPSDALAPRSDDDASAGRFGASGTVASINNSEASRMAVGPALPELSVTAFAARRSVTLPSDEHVTDTVIDDPLAALGVNTQPVAAPEDATFEKSPAAIPLTVSSKESV